ncbi:hypothetical protein BGL38_06475 [Fructilactobacillus sanfranciscensis]|uniref:hypothetical protein n=1 Tax=Fructilactobacillus sanfranciscensis TaxID=1625 RepID=UPI000CD42AF6|nr:hypothetical protein [Fructilactobacillus sanfranciscensis]POH10759.1 hypothetical protein BGL38_06475 [Fructilactobacillus sanfranciscensis]POH13686.1 hypothetical protein BGL40_06605 [Fructilactobacillus sanfranciscensis]POH17611.1 hypothetical protein BGL43_06490 [Fructilactobacillus sanfranciscensis]
MQHYTNFQYILFKINNLINDKKVKLLILGIIGILFLISAIYYTMYRQNFIINNKPKHKNKEKYKKKSIIFFSLSLIIMILFLIGYKVLKKVAINPQSIVVKQSKIVNKGRIIKIDKNPFAEDATYKIKLRNGDIINVNTGAYKTPIKKDILLTEYQGTILTQDVVANGKIGTTVLIKSNKYEYQFKNHDKFKTDKNTSKEQNKRIQQLNKLKVNSEVVMSNDSSQK